MIWAPQLLATAASNSGRALLSYRAVLDSGRRRGILLLRPLHPLPPLLLEPPHAARIIIPTAARAPNLIDRCITILRGPSNVMCLVRELSVFSHYRSIASLVDLSFPSGSRPALGRCIRPETIVPQIPRPVRPVF